MAIPCQEIAGDRLSEQKTEESESQMDFRDQCSGQRKRAASHDPSSQHKRTHTQEIQSQGTDVNILKS
ncbi:hypothetical protein AAFF_G00171830 [Aldrovandia affinis]|uniref:Uncharacterized protein n=1 Tax=Aldrovandia affinis TaxID=143900 RepID=A0AAD7WVV9_9TELE|nr:hypothetical protein AAFF_G00171830 [Aldrovandia affinis]